MGQMTKELKKVIDLLDKACNMVETLEANSVEDEVNLAHLCGCIDAALSQAREIVHEA